MGEMPSVWLSIILLTDSKIIGGKLIIAAFNFFLTRICNVGFSVNVIFQIFSKVKGFKRAINLAAVIKTLKAIFATLECPFVKF